MSVHLKGQDFASSYRQEKEDSGVDIRKDLQCVFLLLRLLVDLMQIPPTGCTNRGDTEPQASFLVTHDTIFKKQSQLQSMCLGFWRMNSFCFFISSLFAEVYVWNNGMDLVIKYPYPDNIL